MEAFWYDRQNLDSYFFPKEVVIGDGDQYPVRGEKGRYLIAFYNNQKEKHASALELSPFHQLVSFGFLKEVKQALRMAETSHGLLPEKILERRAFSKLRFSVLHLLILGKRKLGHSKEHEFLETAELLVEAGADLEARDVMGNTPLHYACSVVPQLDIAKLLIHGGADVNARNRLGRVPCHEVMMIIHNNCFRLLLDAGANSKIQDNDGNFPKDSRVSMELILKEQEELALGTPKCGYCGKGREEAKLSRCQKCLIRFYCGRECQIADWKSHKLHCGKSAEKSGKRCSESPEDGKDPDDLSLTGEKPPPSGKTHIEIMKLRLCMGGYGSPILLFNKLNKPVAAIYNIRRSYDHLHDEIMEKGVHGSFGYTGYFKAVFDSKGFYEVLTDQMVPAQQW